MARELRLERFDIDEVDKVPDVPGVYCWFLVRQISPRAAQDVATFRKQVEELELQLRPSDITLKSEVSFGGTWEGTLVNDQAPLDITTFESLSIKAREMLIQHLNHLLESLASPIYIGKSNDLSDRLKSHINLINRYAEGIPIDSDFEARDFAERLVKRDLDRSHVRFSFFTFPPGLIGAEEQMIANAYAELLCNRVLTPIFGKR